MQGGEQTGGPNGRPDWAGRRGGVAPVGEEDEVAVGELLAHGLHDAHLVLEHHVLVAACARTPHITPITHITPAGGWEWEGRYTAGSRLLGGWKQQLTSQAERDEERRGR